MGSFLVYLLFFFVIIVRFSRVNKNVFHNKGVFKFANKTCPHRKNTTFIIIFKSAYIEALMK